MEKKDTEIPLLEKLAAEKVAYDIVLKEHHEEIKKGVSDFAVEIKRLRDAHNTEVSALNLSYQELSMDSQENLTKKDS